jgi:hypothetical protein
VLAIESIDVVSHSRINLILFLNRWPPHHTSWSLSNFSLASRTHKTPFLSGFCWSKGKKLFLAHAGACISSVLVEEVIQSLEIYTVCRNIIMTTTMTYPRSAPVSGNISAVHCSIESSSSSLLQPQRKSATMRMQLPKLYAVAASWLFLCNYGVSALNRKEQDVDDNYIIGTGIYDM